MKVCNRCGTYDESKRVAIESNRYESNSANGVTFSQVFWFCPQCEDEFLTVILGNFVGNHETEQQSSGEQP